MNKFSIQIHSPPKSVSPKKQSKYDFIEASISQSQLEDKQEQNSQSSINRSSTIQVENSQDQPQQQQQRESYFKPQDYFNQQQLNEQEDQRNKWDFKSFYRIQQSNGKTLKKLEQYQDIRMGFLPILKVKCPKFQEQVNTKKVLKQMNTEKFIQDIDVIKKFSFQGFRKLNSNVAQQQLSQYFENLFGYQFENIQNTPWCILHVFLDYIHKFEQQYRQQLRYYKQEMHEIRYQNAKLKEQLEDFNNNKPVQFIDKEIDENSNKIKAQVNNIPLHKEVPKKYNEILKSMNFIRQHIENQWLVKGKKDILKQFQDIQYYIHNIPQTHYEKYEQLIYFEIQQGNDIINELKNYYNGKIKQYNLVPNIDHVQFDINQADKGNLRTQIQEKILQYVDSLKNLKEQIVKSKLQQIYSLNLQQLK